MSNLDQKTITTALFETWDTIDELLASLDETQWRVPTALPGWDVRAVVAHIIGFESMLLGEAPPEVDVSDVAHVRNAIGATNEQWVRGLRPLASSEILTMYRDTTARRRDVLSAITPQEWEEIVPVTPVGPAPFGRFMRLRLQDCWIHEHDILDALGRTGDEGGARGMAAIGESLGALSHLVGKRAQAPAGSSVTVELTGPLAHVIHITVDNRARVVESLDGPATVTISMDSRLFTRLFNGRTTPAEHADQIAVHGDARLGAQVVSNLAYMI